MDRRAFLKRLGQIGLAAPVMLAAPKLFSASSSASLHDAGLALRMKSAVEARMAADPHFVPMFPPDPADWPAYLAELERPPQHRGYHENEIGMAGVILRQLRIAPEQVRVGHCTQADRVLRGIERADMPSQEREYELQFAVLAPISTDMAWLNARELFPAPALGPRGTPLRSQRWDRRPPEPMCFGPMSTITLNYRIRHSFTS